MALIMTSDFASTRVASTSPESASITRRQTQADLDRCYKYCHDKWPDEPGCPEACRDMIRLGIAPGAGSRPVAFRDGECYDGQDMYGNPCEGLNSQSEISAIADAGDEFFAGVDAPAWQQNIQGDVSNLYDIVSGASSSNIGTLPLPGTVTEEQAKAHANPTKSSTEDYSTYYILGGVAVCGLIAWLILK